MTHADEVERLLADLPKPHRKFVVEQALLAPPMSEQQIEETAALVTASRRRRSGK